MMTFGGCRVGLVCVAMLALLLSHSLIVVDAFFSTGLSVASRLPKVSSPVQYIFHGFVSGGGLFDTAMLNRLVGRFPIDN